MTSIAR